MLAIASAERVLDERRTLALILPRRIYPDRRQVPVGLVRVILRHLIVDGKEIDEQAFRNRALQKGTYRFEIEGDSGR